MDNQIPDAIRMDEKLREKLEDMETQYGSIGGKLAFVMDLISDAEILAGQHGVYCRHGVDARRMHPDMEDLLLNIRASRSLIKNAFRENREEREANRKARESKQKD